jgi:hypothetical protein
VHGVDEITTLLQPNMLRRMLGLVALVVAEGIRGGQALF